MTIYAKVEKGKVVSVGLPETGVLEDGRTVSGYHLLSDKILRKEGWLPVEDERPEYDESTEYLVGPEYKFRGKKVIAEYTVEKIQPPEPVVDERQSIIDEIDNAMTIAEIRRVLVKIVAPEIAKERKMR